ncbi:MAG TPA: hypothetical protein VG714_05810 [Acidobacteriaceae bacterium]|nr:hypothetical protein [Acidobacteriaceae bacterium]
MHADWSVECAADDPVLVVPWSDPDNASGPAFVDLRVHPEELESLRETDRHPPLMQALRALNASRSPFFTAKCDAWSMAEDEVRHLQLDLGLDLNPQEERQQLAGNTTPSACGFASYIDLICRDRSLFASFARQEISLRRFVRLSASMNHPDALLEFILRPALLQLDATQQGYAISMYVKALGESTSQAHLKWGAALNDVVAMLRRPGALL